MKTTIRTSLMFTCIFFVMSLIMPLEVLADSRDNKSLVVVVLMDTSGSMRSSDPNGATSEAVLTAMDLIAHEQPVVYLMEFSGKVNKLSGPTALTYDKLNSIRKTVANRQSSGPTQLNLGLMESHKVMQDMKYRNYRKALIVLSDGQIPNSQHEVLYRYAEELRKLKVQTFVVGLGIEKGQGNILEKITNHSFGWFFGISSKNYLIKDSCHAAIQIALKIMSNNLFAFTDEKSLVTVPREAYRFLSIVPDGTTLVGPSSNGQLAKRICKPR